MQLLVMLQMLVGTRPLALAGRPARSHCRHLIRFGFAGIASTLVAPRMAVASAAASPIAAA